MELATNLRKARQAAGLTQAALAERLGVSDRAVSRWECGTAMPDVALLPGLAFLLNISVDALLGVDSQRRQETIDKALADCNSHMQRGEHQAASALLRTALAAYPDQPELMVALARTLMARHSDEATREALALCRAADGRPARLSTQYGCKQVMALALHRLGKSEQAAQLVSDELPSFWVCRELLYPRVAPGDMAEGQRQFNLLWLTDHLYFTLREMAKFGRSPSEAVTLLEMAVRLYREVLGESAGMYEERICQACLMMVSLHRDSGDLQAARHAWQLAYDAAGRYAAHDGGYAAPWLRLAHDVPTTSEAAAALMAQVDAARP